ncbi:MAG: hypothetical protein M1121_04975 [Actinobacteria bacterium]|nr:hypothetical protein [Actinomycetota bacterium]
MRSLVGRALVATLIVVALSAIPVVQSATAAGALAPEVAHSANVVTSQRNDLHAVATPGALGLASSARTGLAAATAAQGASGFTGRIESSRPDGTIGRWVVAVLLTGVVVLWLVLLGLVVRLRRSRGSTEEKPVTR